MEKGIKKNSNEQEFFSDILASIPKNIKQYVRLSMDIASQINLILKQENLSQKELANRLGKKESEISKWLSGNHNFTLKSLSKIEAVLGQQILFTREEIAKRFLPYVFRQLTSHYKEEHFNQIISYYCSTESIKDNKISFLLASQPKTKIQLKEFNEGSDAIETPQGISISFEPDYSPNQAA